MTPPDLLKEKVQLLEEKLAKKEELLKKYQQALNDSNVRIKKISKHLEESLSLVRDIHKNLLPSRLPQIPGFEFSFKFLPTQQGVSGDFFNVIKIENTMNFGVLLSSCNTYSVTSLFLSSFLKFSSHLKNHKTAKDFLSFVVKKISSSLSKKEKIHLFYGIVSRSSFELDYCLTGDIFVGHKSQGKGFHILPPCALQLYLPDYLELKGGKRNLYSKDILLICSPGVAKRTNEKGQFFGTENIIEAASQNPSAGVLEIRQNVLFSCNEFGKNQPSLRDCTVLAIQTSDPVLKIHKPSSS